MRRSILASSAIVAFSLCSCAERAGGPRASSAPRSERGAREEREETVQRARVPSGQAFRAALDTPLSSERSRPGDRIRAHLLDALIGSDGSVIAPSGTPLVGYVLSVDRAGTNRLTVRLDGLVLARRVYPIDAVVRAVAAARVETRTPVGADDLVATVSPLGPSASAAGAVGGGPPPAVVPLELPRGAEIQLELARPFELAPESSLDAQLR